MAESSQSAASAPLPALRARPQAQDRWRGSDTRSHDRCGPQPLPDRDVISARLAFSIVAGAALAAAIWRHGRLDAVKALEQLSSPLLVPIDDPSGHVSADGETHPAVPQLARGRLLVPIENAGLGPAIKIRGSLTVLSGGKATEDRASVSVLAAGRRAALIFGPHELLADFDLQLTFEDSAGRLHRLTASWHLKQRSYSLTW
jgi:hypothetical protein